MWQDFQIGENCNICTAVMVPGYKNLSENSHEYWWDSCKYSLGGKINKSTKAGQTISNMLITQTDQDTVETYILQLGLDELTPEAIIKLLDATQKAAYQEGKEDKIREIKACLDLE